MKKFISRRDFLKVAGAVGAAGALAACGGSSSSSTAASTATSAAAGGSSEGGVCHLPVDLPHRFVGRHRVQAG